MKKFILLAAVILLLLPRSFGQFRPPFDLRILEITSGVQAIEIEKFLGIYSPAPRRILRRLTNLTVDPLVLYTLQMSNDSNQDVEPAVFAFTLGSTDYTTTAYVKFVPPNDANAPPFVYFSTITNTGGSASGQLPFANPPYTRSADPVLDANTFSDGVNPGRLYLGGLLTNADPRATRAIAVWWSDNGGISWAGPSIVHSEPGGTFVVDKPDIRVSLAPDSRGYLYVSYTRQNNDDSTAQELYLARSTDGGQTFTILNSGQSLATPARVNMTQIVVDNGSGNNLYFFWVNFNANTINMRKSTNYGDTWGAPEQVASINAVPGGRLLNGQLWAATVPIARFNSVVSRPYIVWHESESPLPNPPVPPVATDAYFTFRLATGWVQKTKINQVSNNDQFMPALAVDSSGNILMTWYDRRDDPNNLLYHEYFNYWHPGGFLLQTDTRVSSFQSNPFILPNSGFIGDYQNVWDWTFTSGERFSTTWVGIQTQADIYLSAIH